MSNPTELPELLPCPFCGGPARFESSAMWLDLICDHDKACVLDGDSAEMSYQNTPDAIERMAAKWNRRAQPEGEAPQASFGQEVTRLVAEIRNPCSMAWRDSLVEQLVELIDPNPAATLSPLCGAQHAESGKEVGSIGDLTEFHILLNWYDNEASYGSINDGRNKLTEYIDKWASKRAAQLDGGQEGSGS